MIVLVVRSANIVRRKINYKDANALDANLSNKDTSRIKFRVIEIILIFTRAYTTAI